MLIISDTWNETNLYFLSPGFLGTLITINFNLQPKLSGTTKILLYSVSVEAMAGFIVDRPRAVGVTLEEPVTHFYDLSEPVNNSFSASKRIILQTVPTSRRDRLGPFIFNPRFFPPEFL
jgi:hypothetical protein